MNEETRREIQNSFREAKKKKEQVGILCDLYEQTTEEIEQAIGLAVLLQNGVSPTASIKEMGEREKQECAVRMIREGVPSDNVMHAFGINHSTLFKWKCKIEQDQSKAEAQEQQDAPEPKGRKREKSTWKKWTDAHERLAREMLDSGRSVTEICKAIEARKDLQSISYNTVSARVSKMRLSKPEGKTQEKREEKKSVDDEKTQEKREDATQEKPEENPHAIADTARLWGAYLQSVAQKGGEIGERQVKDMLMLYKMARRM